MKKRKLNQKNVDQTDQTTFNEINQTIYQKESFRHFSVVSHFNYIDFCHEMSNYEFEDARLFSKIHYFISVLFDQLHEIWMNFYVNHSKVPFKKLGTPFSVFNQKYSILSQMK